MKVYLKNTFRVWEKQIQLSLDNGNLKCYEGSGAPSSIVGCENGDYYFDYTNKVVYRYELYEWVLLGEFSIPTIETIMFNDEPNCNFHLRNTQKGDKNERNNFPRENNIDLTKLVSNLSIELDETLKSCGHEIFIGTTFFADIVLKVRVIDVAREDYSHKATFSFEINGIRYENLFETTIELDF